MDNLWPLIMQQFEGVSSFFWGTQIVVFGAFWPLALFFTYLDHKKLAQHYRINLNKYPHSTFIRKAVKLVLFNQILVQGVATFTVYPLIRMSGIDLNFENIPSWWIICSQVMIFMLVEDTLFYWIHRTLHGKYLFSKIHKIHHQFKVSCALASEYAHPLEFYLGNCIPVMAGGILLAMLNIPGYSVHIITIWGFMTLRIFETIDGHCGYDLPFWFPHKIIYGAGSRVHDDHHFYNKGNFASFFTHWDLLGKTEHPILKSQNPSFRPHQISE